MIAGFVGHRDCCLGALAFAAAKTKGYSGDGETVVDLVEGEGGSRSDRPPPLDSILRAAWRNAHGWGVGCEGGKRWAQEELLGALVKT